MMKYHTTFPPSAIQEKTDYLNEIKRTFNDYITLSQTQSKSSLILFYPREVYQIRSQLINWLIFIRNKLSLSLETLFHCVSLFDKYISLSASSTIHYTLYDINLTCIACLSLATKAEEINCNFIQFFTDNILNAPLCQMYTVKQVALKEFDILKMLKFKTLSINAYHFNKLNMELFQGSNSLMYYAKAINEETILLYLSAECYLSYPPFEIALFSFKETLLKLSVYYLTAGFKDSNVLCQQIIAFHQMSEYNEINNSKSSNCSSVSDRSTTNDTYNKFSQAYYNYSSNEVKEQKKKINHHYHPSN